MKQKSVIEIKYKGTKIPKIPCYLCKKETSHWFRNSGEQKLYCSFTCLKLDSKKDYLYE